jgi:hypothetical protein
VYKKKPQSNRGFATLCVGVYRIGRIPIIVLGNEKTAPKLI